MSERFIGSVIFFVFCIAMIVIGLSIDKVEASSIDSIEEGCSEIGKIGTVIVSRCYDDMTGSIFYGNSVGWMGDPVE